MPQGHVEEVLTGGPHFVVSQAAMVWHTQDVLLYSLFGMQNFCEDFCLNSHSFKSLSLS